MRPLNPLPLLVHLLGRYKRPSLLAVFVWVGAGVVGQDDCAGEGGGRGVGAAWRRKSQLQKRERMRWGE